MQRRRGSRPAMTALMAAGRDRPSMAMRNDKHLRAIVRAGQAVNFSVERFTMVGERIAEDNPEIRTEMFDACKDARASGSLIEQLCSIMAPSLRGQPQQHPQQPTPPDMSLDPIDPYRRSPSEMRSYTDRAAMFRSARALLAAVTRVLLVADSVVVKQIVASNDRVSMSMNRLENVANFTEFVKAFALFGTEMIELAQLTSDKQNSFRAEKRRAQMAAARRTLERSTMMLLTTSKACLRHPDCQSARENRDTVFAQMRRAMDTIHVVIKEGIISAAKAAAAGAAVLSAQQTVVTADHSHAGGVTSSAAAAAAVLSQSPLHFRPTSASSSSSSLHLPFDPHNEALLYGQDYNQRLMSLSATAFGLHRPGNGGGHHHHHEMDYYYPKYQRRGQLHRAQRSAPGNSFLLAVESTLRWLHEQLDTCPTIVNFLRRINELLDLARIGPLNSSMKEQIVASMEAAIERTQDFTDSAYTSHEHREKLLLMCDQMKAELAATFRRVTTMSWNDGRTSDRTIGDELEKAIAQMQKLTNEIQCELQDTALEQADELFRLHSTLDLPLLLKNSALACDHEQVDELNEQFREHADHVQEVCRLLFHIAPTVVLQVSTGHTETSIEIHGEQMLTALATLLIYPTSKIAKENYEVFVDVWHTLIGDIGQIMRDIHDFLGANYLMQRRKAAAEAAASHRAMARPQMLAHLPPPQSHSPLMGQMMPSIAAAPMPLGYGPMGPLPPGGPEQMGPMLGDTAAYGPMPAGPAGGAIVHGAMPPPPLPPQQQIDMGGGGGVPPDIAQGMNNHPGAVPPPPPQQQPPHRPTNVSINPEVDVVEIARDDKWSSSSEVEDNDIVRKAKAMSTMAMSMFQFTKGEGELKTTQDLFTQAEFFADEANRLYKIVRHFTYQIPTGPAKKELLDCIDQVPNYVQQLQFAVKNVTVGKTATFTKVDNVINETKNLMSVITKVVAACLNCANKYNLDMQGALRTRSRTLSPSYRADSDMFFEGGNMGSKGGVASSESDI